MGNAISAEEFMVQINRDRLEVSINRSLQEIGLTAVLPGEVPERVAGVLKKMKRILGEIPRGGWAPVFPSHPRTNEGTQGLGGRVVAYIGGVELEFFNQVAKLWGVQQADKLHHDQLVGQFRAKVGEEIEMDPRVVAKRAAITANAEAGEALEMELTELILEMRQEKEDRLEPFPFVADEREL